MSQNRVLIGAGIIVLLILANIIRYVFLDWGLITIHAHEMPLAQVIKSIDRQGWVTIYTDMDPTTPVTMDCDKAPLAEAMETLTANIGGQWKLGFFTAPTSAQVKNEIRSFQTGTAGDDTKIYSYQTPLQMLATDPDMPAADPRLQAWPGYQAPPPAPAPPPPADGSQPDQPPAPPAPPSNLQDYLNAFAQESDIWVMSTVAWAPPVTTSPAPNSSIIRAVKNLVGNAHGSVEQAIVLQARRRGGGFGGGDTGWAFMEDRMRNAINGLPADYRPTALAQLDQEVKFQQQVQAAPPADRRNMMREHFRNRMGANDWRRSPEKRAAMYARVVSNRVAARGQ
jgi:hypothetical protein